MFSKLVTLAATLSLGVTLLASCSKSAGTASKLNPSDFAKPQTAGNFSSQRQAPIGANGQFPPGFELHGQIPCPATGAGYTVDPRLHIGDEMTISQSGGTPSQVFSMTERLSTQEIAADHIKNLVNVSDIIITPAPGFNIPSTFQQLETCQFSPYASNCTSSFINWAPTGKMEPTESCSANIKDMGTGTVELGFFTTQAGLTVQARKIHQTFQNVSITCKTGDGPVRDAGSGTLEMITIETNDVVNMRPVSCGMSSTDVYSYSITKLADGSTVGAYRQEILSATIR